VNNSLVSEYTGDLPSFGRNEAEAGSAGEQPAEE
jgi:hypothetical protein